MSRSGFDSQGFPWVDELGFLGSKRKHSRRLPEKGCRTKAMGHEDLMDAHGFVEGQRLF